MVAAFMGNIRPTPTGRVIQQHLKLCLDDGIETEEELWLWLQERLLPRCFRRSAFDVACRAVEQSLEDDLWVASVEGGLPPLGGSLHCPWLVLGKGDKGWKAPGIAWLNSRKPRMAAPDASWLRALRTTLEEIGARAGTLVASSGILTHDLVSAFAHDGKLPLLRILPHFHGFKGVRGVRGSPAKPWGPATDLTCQFGGLHCPKAVRWTCRDRMLAHLADVHVVLELRASSGLIPILAAQHRRSSRAVWMLAPESGGDTTNAGNRALMDQLPEPVRLFHATDAPEPGRLQAPGAVSVDRSSLVLCSPKSMHWEDYLFHYTRSCHGPWPGEDFRDYCLSLLRGDPLSAHTALATLSRMINEGRIRASRLLVRGGRAVVSLTSRPPHELHRFRRWNRSQARWTLEPYGMAIRKGALRKRGVKPTIYGDETVYRLLRAVDRHRFQSTGPRASWMAEREWRLDGDLCIREFPLEDWLAFVPDRADAERLAGLVTVPFRCIVWGETSSRSMS
jgi:hypothetical protein